MKQGDICLVPLPQVNGVTKFRPSYLATVPTDKIAGTIGPVPLKIHTKIIDRLCDHLQKED